MQKDWKQAGELKDLTSEAMCDYFRITDDIGNDVTGWSWAQHENTVLDKSKTDVDKFFVKSVFWKDFVLNSIVDLKLKYPSPLDEFKRLTEADEAIKKFRKQIKTMVHMHAAALKHEADVSDEN